MYATTSLSNFHSPLSHSRVPTEEVKIEDAFDCDFDHNLQLLNIVGGRIRALDVALTWRGSYDHTMAPAFDQAFGILALLRSLKMSVSCKSVEYAAELLSRLVAPALETLYLGLRYHDAVGYLDEFFDACIRVSDVFSNVEAFPRLQEIVMHVEIMADEDDCAKIETDVMQTVSGLSARGILILEWDRSSFANPMHNISAMASRSPASKLPPELINMIVRSGDFWTQMACGLVAKKWYPPSRADLFKHALLYGPKLISYKNLLDRSPHLGHYVREVGIVGIESAYHVSCLLSIVKHINNAERLELIFNTQPPLRAAEFTNIGPVKELHLECASLIEGDEENLLAIAEYLETFPRVTNLSLAGIYQQSPNPDSDCARLTDALSKMNIRSLQVDSYTAAIGVSCFKNYPPANLEKVDIRYYYNSDDFSHSLRLMKTVGGYIKVLQLQFPLKEEIDGMDPDEAFGNLTQLKSLGMYASYLSMECAAELLSRLVAPALESIHMVLEYHAQPDYAAQFHNACVSISDIFNNVEAFPRLQKIAIDVAETPQDIMIDPEAVETEVTQSLSGLSAGSRNFKLELTLATNETFGTLTQLRSLGLRAIHAYVYYAAELFSELVAPALEMLHMELEYDANVDYATQLFDACVRISEKLDDIDAFPRLRAITILVSGTTEDENQWAMMEVVVMRIFADLSDRGNLKLEFKCTSWE
ncbi:hypothetical protein CERSUDRAFT_96848 [Gelatoporia subvermispora B]|uniref:Uncharacterized protein n=1 Tax=Ceriporiopsis subvermispora (strain B) TaxID=914234 RepID=M2QSC7_CERS8|nr:hypothetical protein CERSUDRAFT_96848 [Gelatoporia subvermispora B]